MMRHVRVSPLLLLLGTVPAFADDEPEGDPDGYAAAGGVTGRDTFEFQGVSGEVGHRLGRTQVFGRALAEAGNLQLPGVPGRGTFTELRVGVEGRRCRGNGMFCASLGLDVGQHRASFTPTDLTPASQLARPRGGVIDDPGDGLDALVIVPRLTIDGGARIRVRGVLELPQHERAGANASGVAVSLSLGVAY